MENVKSVDSYLNGAFQRRFEFRRRESDFFRYVKGGSKNVL